MTEHQKGRFQLQSDIDMAHGIPGVSRFRMNVFQQWGSLGMAIRFFPHAVLNIAELHLPNIVQRLCNERRGLVLVTGSPAVVRPPVWLP